MGQARNRLIFIHYGNSYTGKTASLYQMALELVNYSELMYVLSHVQFVLVANGEIILLQDCCCGPQKHNVKGVFLLQLQHFFIVTYCWQQRRRYWYCFIMFYRNLIDTSQLYSTKNDIKGILPELALWTMIPIYETMVRLHVTWIVHYTRKYRLGDLSFPRKCRIVAMKQLTWV